MSRQRSAMSSQLLFVFTALWAAQLTFALRTSVALSEAKSQKAENGTLVYSTLSNSEYSDAAEEKKRYGLFLDSLAEIDSQNTKERAANGSAVFGVTIFSDLSDEEFRETYLGTQIPADEESNRKLTAIAPAIELAATTTYADWRGIYTTPIKDQGGCGSCWAFSAVAQIESDAILAGLLNTESILSAQQMVKCTYTYDGCHGGFSQTGYGYVARAGGITYEDFYPYDVTTSYCDKSKNDYAVTVTMSYRVDGEANMIKQVLAGRTLSVSVDANSMGNYRSGVFRSCPANYNVNHAVNIVGVNVTGGYWIIRNSWGDWWGDNGYMKIAMGSNMCGINNYATYTDVKLPLGARLPHRLPSKSPTSRPTQKPTPSPSPGPTRRPTPNPSSKPSVSPTPRPTAKPSAAPTSSPSRKPSNKPSAAPTSYPTAKPSAAPTSSPSRKPSNKPSAAPASYPTAKPSAAPTSSPSSKPSNKPTAAPTSYPTAKPGALPSSSPSARPSNLPSAAPKPPTVAPTSDPSVTPSASPSSSPSARPSNSPSAVPKPPTVAPTSDPSVTPSASPSCSPSARPSNLPSAAPISADFFNSGTSLPIAVRPSRSPLKRTARPTRKSKYRTLSPE